MTLREFGQAVEYNIEHGLKYAVLGLGPAGVGKSQIIRQIGKKYGYKVIDIRLAQMSEVEIGGLIYPNAERTKTVWLSPEILPDEKRDGEHTILLLDEITSCTKRVQVAAYQLILDRRIGQYTLPEGTYVVALGNREDDDGVFIRLAAPLADRFEIHEIDVDFQSWKEDYALKHGVHPYVVDYLTSKPSALHTQKQDGDSMVFATPRSWDRVSDILHFDSNTQKRVIQHKIIGNIGTREGAQFIAFCNSQSDRLVAAEDYLSGKRAAPNDPEKQRLLTQALVSSVFGLRETASARQMSERDRSRLERVILGLLRLPGREYAVMGIRELLQKNRPVVSEVFLAMDDPAVTRFLQENASYFR